MTGRFMPLLVVLAVVGSVLSAPAWADDDRYALGIGFGLVEPSDNDVETYLTANFRIRVGDREQEAKRDEDLDWADADAEAEEREDSRSGSSEEFIRGYLEPEIGIWDGDVRSDALLGLNIIGVIPFRSVDMFIGAGLGVHFNDSDLPDVSGLDSDDDTAIGANAQFGLDLNLSEKLAIFGVGRFDLVERSNDRVEAKAFLGLRFKL